nr:hypothetical protein [Desulfobacteraceae bacterium]
MLSFEKMDLPKEGSGWNPASLQAEITTLLGAEGAAGDRLLAALPFACGDATAGVEDELQAVVVGDRSRVDLAISLEQSNYLKNIRRRVAAGELPPRVVADFERYLEECSGHSWDNSWVRFPWAALSPAASQVFQDDLLADKRQPDGPLRRDIERFIFQQQGEQWLRMPISYLLKLALADAAGREPETPPLIRRTGGRLLAHFLNDNTSPETFSFHVTPLRRETANGRAVAKESLKRFLLTQLLVEYANEQFGLRRSGQHAMVYFAPNAPGGQRRLNELVPDSFYRELFMSPCLSGWDEGEAKHRYMILCHQTLSRSHLNGVAKLKEAGIITRNLVVLPNISNLSLANNGTHVSLGSRRLGALLADRASGFGPAHEKHAGDLAIKIVEHFLPLFVGTYSAAPYRLDFEDFHPERALGFLPHELDYTHLRMIWRRWTRKANLKIFGHPVTPFGPPLLDRSLQRLFSLRGDLVPDFRLIDYLVALRSTDQSPALDGRLGSGERLKQDLTAMGVFDSAMSLYLLYRLRKFRAMGFSGFEGRHYSLFASLEHDLSGAVDLQLLLTALAFKYILTGQVSHAHIPDDPTVESERRQIFFGRA